MSEIDENKFSPVIKEEEPQEGSSPKGNPDRPNPEDFNFNMLISMSEKEREIYISKKIRSY